jgi:uncharacterized membrane protein
MKLLFSLISLHLLFLSCNHSTKTPKQPGTTAALNIPADSSSVLDTSFTSAIPIKTFEGLLLTSKSANILKVCDGKSSYILIDENKLATSAYQKTINNLAYQNESVYARIMGYFKSKDTLIVTSTVDIKPKSFLTPCFNFEFILLGTEPFWSVEIIPNEDIIALKDVSAEKSYVFPYSKPSINGNEYSYVSKNEKGDTIEIIIRKENCNDGMSDRNYQYSSQIKINGKPMTGCAIKKGDKL